MHGEFSTNCRMCIIAIAERISRRKRSCPKSTDSQAWQIIKNIAVSKRNESAKNCFTIPNENLTSRILMKTWSQDFESFLIDDNNQGAKRTEAYGDPVLRFDALYYIESGDALAIELEDVIICLRSQTLTHTTGTKCKIQAPVYSIAMISSPPDHSTYCNMPRAYSARVHTCP